MAAYTKKMLLQLLLISALLILVMTAPLSWAEGLSTVQPQGAAINSTAQKVAPSTANQNLIMKVATCDQGQIRCSNTCVDPRTDQNNCGACGHTCPSGQVCNQGVCSCPSGKTLCGDKCADLGWDNANCGSCWHKCDPSSGKNNKSSCKTGVCQGDK